MLGLELNLLVLLAERRRPAVAWAELLPILAAAVPGTVCGVLVLRALPKSALQIVVGLLVIAAAIVRVRMRHRVVTPRWRAAAVGSSGSLTGALTTSSG